MKINSIVSEILNKRGIVTQEDIEEFLSDKPKKTYDPFLLLNMEAGVDLILSEIHKGSRICIYGDYDADGITSTVVMLSILSHLTDEKNLEYYIPSRFEEGYGLNKEAIKVIADKGFNMIITVDCGSVSYDEVEYAKKLGLTILVTDHHTITDTIADCLIINPKQAGCPYPFKHLAGCGVAFKVAQALQKKGSLPKSVLTEILDLVSIGTMGDIMPLVDENRTITKFGLKMINSGRREGLARLMEGASLKVGKITSENVSYVIVPHLNASGRIEDASIAVELLRCGTPPQTIDASQALNERVSDLLEKNKQRKKIQQDSFKSCIEQLEADGEGTADTVKDFILIKSDDIHEGIAGIVAGKIKETFYRPTVIVTWSGEEKKYLKGTGRSIEGVNLYELLKTQENLFEKFGGHAGACGFLMKEENLPELREGLDAAMKALVGENREIFRKAYNIDMEVEVEDLSLELAEDISLLAPFGNQNPAPLFLCMQVTIGDVKYMGDRNQHMRFLATSRRGTSIQCVLFNKAQDYGISVFARRPVDLIGTVDCNEWQGVKRLQFLTEEIKFD